MSKRNVSIIPARPATFGNLAETAAAKRRVAAYARVSTERGEQKDSYEAQVEHFTGFIKQNPDWEFVAVYSDEVSGTSTKNRDGFNQMIADALDGKIDLIISKAVSRFARNTVDSLSTIRKLKERGIEVYFEKENIYTMDGKGELLITIMSSIAQEESRSISENVKQGVRWRFENGKVYLPYKRFLGYEKGSDGLPQIVESQAAIVRQIYHMYLQGKTLNFIARHLSEAGIPTPGGKDVWNPRGVFSILTNEKYKGEALLQKEYIADFLTKRKVKNNGEVQQYYVKNSHPAIIPPDIWALVEAEVKKRKDRGHRHSGLSHFSSRIICGDCGSFYGPKVWDSNKKNRRTVWQCNHKYGGEAVCTTPHVTETALEAAFVEAFNLLFSDREKLLDEYAGVIDVLFDNAAVIERQCNDLSAECEVITELIRKCVMENAATAQDQDEYRARYESLTARYETAKARLDELIEAKNDCVAQREGISRFLAEVLERGHIMTAFDVETWCAAVDTVAIHRNGLVMTFKNGSAIPLGTK
jgi:DNA invertase Pin-like site-specific DNA recombinase